MIIKTTVLCLIKKIKITEEKIHKVFGLPNGGRILFDFHFVDSEHETYVTWKSQFTKETMNATRFKEAILKSKRDDDIFNLNFLSLFVNTFAESHSYGTCNIDPVRRLIGVEDISCIDTICILKLLYEEYKISMASR